MEILILLAIILLFFGAKRLPKVGSSLGRSLKEFREGFSERPDGENEVREGNENEKLSR